MIEKRHLINSATNKDLGYIEVVLEYAPVAHLKRDLSKIIYAFS